jgi:hypothetical protein
MHWRPSLCGTIATFRNTDAGAAEIMEATSTGCAQTENDFDVLPVAIRWQFSGRRARNPITPG